LPTCHFIGGNYWIIKTTYQNRGIGIYVFKTLKQLQVILNNYVIDVSDKDENVEAPFIVQRNLTFIIQKYIERPFLIHKRKFDIRVFCLINQDLEVFFYKEGYLRTSCQEYKLDNCEDQLIHLTNNAVQKQAKGYGRFEDGNQLDFD